MIKLDESSLNDLRNSAIIAFPNTTKRQHATGPIVIEEFHWIPFLGVKTLFVKADAINEDRKYSPMILFKNVNYNGRGTTIIDSVTGKPISLNKLSLSKTDVLLRCQCEDFKYRFSYYNWHDRSLYGSKPKKYESKGGPPANPKELEGMCKHIMKLAEVIRENGHLKR